MAESLILASRSPRRAALLRQAGFRFRIMTRSVDESRNDDMCPEAHVRELSEKKAAAVRPDIRSGLIVGADTIVYIDGEMLGKPADKTHAFQMISRLSGQTHRVYTGLTLMETGGITLSEAVCTEVTFRLLSKWEIEAYVETGGPMDKAGAYGIQERAGVFVSGIRGCYFNVMGFPLSRFFEMLKQIWDERFIRRHLAR